MSNVKRDETNKNMRERTTKIIRNGLHHPIYVYVGHFSADVRKV